MTSWALTAETLDALAETARAALGDALLETTVHAGELTLAVRREAILGVLATLRDHDAFQCRSLMTLCGADYPERAERFDVVYHLLSYAKNLRLRVKLTTDADTPVPSAVSVFPAAGWYERETWDLYGVIFDGHPDLRRILTDYGFTGHPLRKDFPLTGFVEVRYSEEHKRVVYEPVKLTQDFRSFDFMSPWEGAQYVLPGDEKAQGGKPA